MEIKREKFRACFNIGGGKDGVSKKTQKRDKTGATLHEDGIPHIDMTKEAV